MKWFSHVYLDTGILTFTILSIVIFLAQKINTNYLYPSLKFNVIILNALRKFSTVKS